MGELCRIHPYIKGNGRVARLIVNWLNVYYGETPPQIKSSYLNIMIDKAIYFWVEANIKQLLGPESPSYALNYNQEGWDHWLQHINI